MHLRWHVGINGLTLVFADVYIFFHTHFPPYYHTQVSVRVGWQIFVWCQILWEHQAFVVQTVFFHSHTFHSLQNCMKELNLIDSKVWFSVNKWFPLTLARSGFCQEYFSLFYHSDNLIFMSSRLSWGAFCVFSYYKLHRDQGWSLSTVKNIFKLPGNLCYWPF